MIITKEEDGETSHEVDSNQKRTLLVPPGHIVALDVFHGHLLLGPWGAKLDRVDQVYKMRVERRANAGGREDEGRAKDVKVKGRRGKVERPGGMDL